MNSICKLKKQKIFMAMSVLLCVLSFFSGSDAAQTRGFMVIEDSSGNKVGLYRESHALVIGVSDYTAGWPDLESIPGEIAKVEAALKAQGFDIESITDPDSETLKRGFEKFINRYGFDKDNRLLFFFSGHGHSRENKGYIVPADAPDPRKDEKGFARKAVEMAQIMTWAKRIESKHALFLFDSCFSGSIFKVKALPQYPPHISSMTSKPVRQFVSAGSADEQIPARSVFTPLFVRALKGEGDLNRDGYVTGTELGMYLHEKVLSYEVGETPQYGKIKDPDLDEGDFVFVADSGGAVITTPVPEKETSLVIRPNVSDAEVWINGKKMGKGTLRFEKIQPGAYRIRITRDGYDPYEKRVEVEKGESQEVTAYLEKIEKPVAEDVKPETVAEPVSPGTWKDPVTGMEFVFVKGGCYEMGCGAWTNSCFDNEKPVHEVCVDDFYMGKYEVTQGQWQKIMGNNPSYLRSGSNYPVENISWNDANEFVEKLNQKNSGRYKFRLPTEAEWEYAARSGGKKETFAGFSNESRLYEYANFCDANCGNDWKDGIQNDGYKYTSPVGTYKPNGLGIYDMSGNIWEWCMDWYGDYPSGSVKNPTGADGGSYRVGRGGSWDGSAQGCRSACRDYGSPGNRHGIFGFRLCAKIN